MYNVFCFGVADRRLVHGDARRRLWLISLGVVFVESSATSRRVWATIQHSYVACRCSRSISLMTAAAGRWAFVRSSVLFHKSIRRGRHCAQSWQNAARVCSRAGRIYKFVSYWVVYRMHEMRPITNDDFVALFVSLSVTRLRCAKTAGRIEVAFAVETLGGPKHTVLDEGFGPLRRGGRAVKITPTADMKPVEISWPDPIGNVPVRPVDQPAIIFNRRPVLGRPVDQQNLQNMLKPYVLWRITFINVI